MCNPLKIKSIIIIIIYYLSVTEIFFFSSGNLNYPGNFNMNCVAKVTAVLFLAIGCYGNRLLELNTVDDYLNVCMDGVSHKLKPGPEGDLFQKVYELPHQKTNNLSVYAKTNAYQLCSHICLRYSDSTIPLLLKSKISSL